MSFPYGLPASIANQIQASPPNVPVKSVNSLTATPGTPTLRRAVLHQVSPNLNNPAVASVLIENRLPPRAGFTLPSGFGPVYAAGTAGVKGPFVNSLATNSGGSFVLVDTNTNSVVSLSQGVSTQFPSSAAALVAHHVHTGLQDANGNPMPSPIDLVSHVQGQLTKPNLSSFGPNYTPVVSLVGIPTFPFNGNPLYDTEFVFQTDLLGTSSDLSLSFIQLVAYPDSVDVTVNNKYGKVLYDLIATFPNRASYDGSTLAIDGARYHAYVGGLTGGINYKIALIYVDLAGNNSNAVVLFDTGSYGSHGVTNNVLPGIGVIPTITVPNPPTYSGSGQATFNALLGFTINYFGTGDSAWVQEIELYATLWDSARGVPPGSPYLSIDGATQAAPTLMNVMSSFDVNDANASVVGEWPVLAAQNSVGTPFIYQLGVKFVAQNGQRSALQVLTYTTPQNLIIYRSTLSAFGANYTPNVSILGTPAFPFNGNPLYDTEFVFQTDITGTASDSSLSFIQLVAYPDSVDVTLNNNFGKILYDLISPLPNRTSYDGSTLTVDGARYHVYVGGLTGGTNYKIALIYIDLAGNKSNTVMLFDTGSYGSHAVTHNVLPGIGVIPTITVPSPPTYSGSGQATFNALLGFTINYFGTGDAAWIQEIGLYATLWDPSRGVAPGSPYLSIDSATQASPTLMNIMGSFNTNDANASVVGEWPVLAAQNSNGTPFVYQLGVKFIAQNGDRSVLVPLAYTNGQQLVIYRPTLATMPLNYVSGVNSGTSSATISGFNNTHRVARIAYSFDFNSLGSTANPWLDHVRVVALKYADNIAYSGSLAVLVIANDNVPNVNITGGNTLQANRLNIYTQAAAAIDLPASSGQHYEGVLDLPVGGSYAILAVQIDHSGKASAPGLIGIITQLGNFNSFGGGGAITPITSVISASFVKNNNALYDVLFAFTADTANYSDYVEFVDVFKPIGGGNSTLAAHLPYRLDGTYNCVLHNLTLNSNYVLGYRYTSYARDFTNLTNAGGAIQFTTPAT